MAVENGRPASFLSKKLEADEIGLSASKVTD